MTEPQQLVTMWATFTLMIPAFHVVRCLIVRERIDWPELGGVTIGLALFFAAFIGVVLALSADRVELGK